MKKHIFCALALTVALIFGAASAQTYLPGTYEGESQGFGGIVKVTLTVNDSAITAVEAQGDQETEGIGAAALSTLAEQILAQQGADIDGVAGATVTTGGVKEAAANAIAAATGKKAEAAPLTDGTYTATKTGYQKEHVTVSVTVENGAIADVSIVEVTDHPSTITDAPCQQLPAAIVANQSYQVDGVTGATMTSNAIKGAVRDCLEQAGGAEAFSAPVPAPEIVPGEDVHTDVLVVGGGAAGMTAAMEAYNSQELGTASGLGVTLIEKAGFLGGNTSVSGGCFYTYVDETGAYDEAWRQAVTEQEAQWLSVDIQDGYNRDLIYGETGVMNRTLQLLNHANVTYTDMGYYLCFDPPVGGEDKKWAGSYMTKKVMKYLPQTGIDVRLNTTATSLLTDENGDVLGVAVQDKTSTYNIYAKKVILACGGFAASKDMIAQYAPGYENTLLFGAGTNTGDGIRMATEIGAGIIGNTLFGNIGVDGTIGIRPDFCMPFIFGNAKFMGVNANGERFGDESRSRYEIYQDVVGEPDATCWGIVDSDNENANVLGTDSDVEAGYVYVADTLEELAGKIGVPAETLAATAQTYNATIDQQGQDAFGVAVEMMDRLDCAPYYAFVIRPCAISSLVGLTVDGECRVLNTQGEVIGNLFAAGDMITGNLMKCYVAARGVGTALYSGDLAATTAKTEIEAGK